jgi:hypothetical protein
MKKSKNKYFRVIVRDIKTEEEEESNRVEDVGEFINGYDVDDYSFVVEKLTDEEFEDTGGED